MREQLLFSHGIGWLVLYVELLQGERNVSVHLCKKAVELYWKWEVSYIEHFKVAYMTCFTLPFGGGEVIANTYCNRYYYTFTVTSSHLYATSDSCVATIRSPNSIRSSNQSSNSLTK